jgi:hypothetical protein
VPVPRARRRPIGRAGGRAITPQMDGSAAWVTPGRLLMCRDCQWHPSCSCECTFVKWEGWGVWMAALTRGGWPVTGRHCKKCGHSRRWFAD